MKLVDEVKDVDLKFFKRIGLKRSTCLQNDVIPTVEYVDSYDPKAIWSNYKDWKQFNNDGNFNSKDKGRSSYWQFKLKAF